MNTCRPVARDSITGKYLFDSKMELSLILVMIMLRFHMIVTSIRKGFVMPHFGHDHTPSKRGGPLDRPRGGLKLSDFMRPIKIVDIYKV